MINAKSLGFVPKEAIPKAVTYTTMRQATRAIHAGKSENNAVASPIALSSTYVWPDIDTEPAYIYSRYQNPNREELEATVGALEGAAYTTAFASGMAAITAALSIATCGEHVLLASDLYGGSGATASKILTRHGIGATEFDALNPESLRDKAQPNTTVMLFESPTNPLLRICDIKMLTDVARELGIVSVVDNTFATPILQQPLALGADVVVHSTSKYLGGHSDVVGGIASTNRKDLHDILYAYAKVAGAVPGPFDAWLVLRGVRSLSSRMRTICESAAKVADFLASHPRIQAVHFPGLQGHPGRDLAKRQMSAFGGMMSAEIGRSADDVRAFVSKCKVFSYAASLGGAESLLSWPPMLSHAMMTEEQRLDKGIKPNLLRISIGLEDSDDLIEDLEQALK